MSRWTNLFTRKRVVILALLVLTAAAIYTWQVTRTREPVVLTYCLRYGPYKPDEDPRQVQPMSSCVQTKTLKIPAAYYGVWSSGPGSSPPSWFTLEAAYPSMKPWATVPWLEQSKTHKIDIQLEGVTSQTVRESFSNYFLGTPKPTHVVEPLFGLDRFDLPDDWYTMFLLPLEAEPRLHIGCGGPVWTTGQTPVGFCVTKTRTNWQLKLIYFSPKYLLPQWQDMHNKVITLVDSFIVTP